jgi:hypothetical protein
MFKPAIYNKCLNININNNDAKNINCLLIKIIFNFAKYSNVKFINVGYAHTGFQYSKK